MNPIIKYFQERFPPVPVLLFASGYAAYVIALSSIQNPWHTEPIQTTIRFLTIMGIFIAFLLRQRAVDEFRDFLHDKKHFPNRPLHRGLVTPTQITLIGISAFITELVLVISLGSFYLYIPVLLFSFLMAKDFFIKKWLSTHFTAHFAIHEFYFAILAWFYLSLSQIPSSFTSPDILARGLLLVTAPMSVEVIRKYKPRFNSQGKPVKDTYVTVWGNTHANSFLFILTILNGVFLAIVRNNPLFAFAGFVLAISIWFTKKHHSRVVIIGATQFLILALISNLIW